MNILLDAYFDRNFGDDLFVDTITKLYAEYKFYAFMEYYPSEIQKWAERIPNLYLLPDCAVMLRKGFFDAYICVGGDIFPDGGDFSKRKAWVDAVKAANGKIFFLGFSLFSNYSEQTQREIMDLMKDADVIAPRDGISAELLRKWMPEREIPVMADLGFLAKWAVADSRKPKAVTRLGIAVRRPGYAEEAAMEAYNATVAEIINEFLTEEAGREAVILALSSGSVRDKEVAAAIIEKVTEPARVRICTYDGDLENMQQELKQCDLVICTRFHALVACIAMGIPYCPVNYEVKMDNLLQEIGYPGEQFHFKEIKYLRDHWKSIIAQPVENWTGNAEKVTCYLQKGRIVIDRVSGLLAATDTEPFIKKDTSGADCEEKDTIKECQETITQYLKTIEECQKTNADYFKIIEEVNAAKAREQELLQKRIAEQAAEFEEAARANASVQEALQQEKRTLEEKLEEKQKLLECMRPFFAEGRRKRLMKRIAIFKKGEKEALEEKWNLLEEYFNK